MENVYVIKIGGNVIDNEDELSKFLESFAGLQGNKILVHGGGKLASALEKKLGISTNMIDGRRVTSKESLEVVCMVYAGLINKKIIAKLQALNCNAIGLCGVDGNSLRAKKRKAEPIDFGFVGDVTSVNVEFIKQLLDDQICPVFSAITHDGKGHLLNSNADGIASAIAVAMSDHYKVHLIYCFEKPGVLMDANDDKSVVEQVSKNSFDNLIHKGIISSGMIPKLSYAFTAKEKGTHYVVIGNAKCLTELTRNNHGTCIVS